MKSFEYLKKRRRDIDHRVAAGCDAETGEVVFLNEADREVHMYVCGVSGSGKTRFLESLILQDLAKGHPLCVIDPMGALYQKALQAVTYGIERAEDHGFSRYDLLDRYVFLDITDSDNPVRFNPLEPQGDETAEESVDDFLKAIERLLPEGYDAQRRMRRVLRSILLVLAELNRLPKEQRPQLPSEWSYPVSLRFAGDFLYLSNEERSRLLAPLSSRREDIEAVIKTWGDFATWTPRDQVEFRNSTLNTLDWVTSDSLVRRFFYCNQSTIRIQDLLQNGRSLFCHFPLSGSLSGAQLLGKFLVTKFQRCAYRRPRADRSKPYYLYVDEFQHFADEEYANATTNLRQFGLRLINAHQSQNQPPFHTSDGKPLLHTIRANSKIKAIFQVDRDDAEALSKELFVLSQEKLNFVAEKFSQTDSTQENWSQAFSFQVTRGTAENWSRGAALTLAKTATIGVGRSSGTNIGETLTKGFGGSRANSLARAISRSESRGVSESFSMQHGISVAIGENWSQMRDHRRGFSLTVGENRSFAVQRGLGQSYSEMDQRGETDTEGRSSQLTLGEGTNIERGSNGSIAYYDEGSVRTTRGDSSSSGSMQSIARANGSDYSKAISRIQGISRGFEESQGLTETQGRKEDMGMNWGEGTSNGLGGSRQESISDSSTWNRGESHQESLSETETQSLTTSENWEQSLAQAFSILEQVSRTYSEALQEAASFTDTIGASQHFDISEGEAQSVGGSRGRSLSRSEEPVYYSLEGERELFINELQTLPRQHFFLSVSSLKACYMKALEVDDQHYVFRVEDLPQFILEEQRESLRPRVTLPREGDHIRLIASDEDDKKDVAMPEDWPFEG